MISKVNNWDDIPSESRFWCFCAQRPWSKDEKKYLYSALNELCASWKAHGHPIKAGFKTIESRLIGLCADEASKEASGCSIDSRMHYLNDISAKLDINLFNRMHIYVREDASSEWLNVSLKDAKKIKYGEFLNTVARVKGDWNPISKIQGSWISPPK